MSDETLKTIIEMSAELARLEERVSALIRWLKTQEYAIALNEVMAILGDYPANDKTQHVEIRRFTDSEEI